jgi:hypothetical protein
LARCTPLVCELHLIRPQRKGRLRTEDQFQSISAPGLIDRRTGGTHGEPAISLLTPRSTSRRIVWAFSG